MPEPARIAAYLEHLKAVPRSEKTIQAAQLWLAVFQRWCHQQQVFRLDQLSPRHLEDFRQGLSWSSGRGGRLYAAHTVDLALRMVRTFLRWALPGQSHEDPTCGLILPRQKERPLRLLSPVELARLLDAPDLARAPDLRDRLLLELVCEGLSMTASTRIDLADLSGVQLRAQSGHALRPTTMRLPDELAPLLRRYLDEARPQLRPTTPALLVSIQGKRLTMAAGLGRLKRWAREAGLARVPRAQELAASRRAQRQAFAERRFFFNRGL